MAPETSFLIITWVVIALLALGLAGCLRAIRTLSLRLDDAYQSPRRLQVGDALAVPPSVAAAAGAARHVALLFATASCAACTTAVDALQPVTADLDEVALQVLWGEEPPAGYEGVGLAHQREVFQTLRVPVTPLLVVVDTTTSTVVARGLLGSPDELRRAEQALRALEGPRRRAVVTADVAAGGEDR